MTRFEIINRTTGKTVTANGRLLDDRRSKSRGLMFRRDLDDDLAYIFRYPEIARRGVHMLFVFQPIDVLWLQYHEVHRKSTLRPFIDHEAAEASTFIEFPAGGADGIRVGDKLDWGPR